MERTLFRDGRDAAAWCPACSLSTMAYASSFALHALFPVVAVMVVVVGTDS